MGIRIDIQNKKMSPMMHMKQFYNKQKLVYSLGWGVKKKHTLSYKKYMLCGIQLRTLIITK